MARAWLGLLLLLGLSLPRASMGEPVVHARIDRAIHEYEVNRDLTFTRTETVEITLFTDRALRRLDRSARTFHSDKQKLEVVEAWVDQPDGTRVPVASSGVFTRPSAASQSAPGFVNSDTTTVLFPRLRSGSRTHIVWRFTQNTPGLLGFNAIDVNNFDWDTGLDETRISIPADVPLHWRARGGFTVEDQTENGIRRIAARIEGTRGREMEPAMVSASDFMPLFVATSLSSLEAIGAIIHRGSEGRAGVTPEIAERAAAIAGELSGLDAARAIHAWVAENIRYVAVYLSPDDGYIPHSAEKVLKAGYGDCKDYVVLMRALLAARGIEGQMAAVDWGTRYTDPPLWSPFFFNHAILYLPAYDRYLNPTDRNAGFDALDRRLSGKPVVLATAEGQSGRTPASTLGANRYRYAARVVVGPDGAIDGTARFTLGPNQEILARGALAGASSMSDLAQRMLINTPEGGFGRFQASDPRALLRPLDLSGSWRSPMAVNVQDRDTFLRVPSGLDLNPPKEQRLKLMPAGTRQTPVLADVTDTEWETEIVLPPGTSVVHLPPDTGLVTPAGRYTAQYRQENGSVMVRRNLVIEQDVVPPEGYPDLERLIYAPLVDSRSVIVLTRPVR